MNETIVLYALRYSFGRENFSLSNTSKFITKHLEEFSNHALKTYLNELEEYYKYHPNDGHYLTAHKLMVAIRKELYGED